MNRFDQQHANGAALDSYRSPGAEAEGKVERVLSDFFRHEMPNPWPEVPVFQAAPVIKRRMPWLRMRSRLALAASIALVVCGYLLLAGMFPAQEGGGSVSPSGPVIGKGLKVIPLQRDTTGSGVQVDSWGVKTPGGATIINVQEVAPKR